MQPKNYKEVIAELKIQRLIDAILNLFTTCNSRQGTLQKLKEILQALDEHNPEFYEMRHDFRENTKMLWYLFILALGSLIDYLLLFNAIIILCALTSLPGYLRYVIPPVLILAEISVAYFTGLKQQQDSRSSSRKYTFLPYFLLFILIGFSVLVILYALTNYDPGENGGSFMGFAFGTILSQIFFLIGSIIYHIVLIRHAEEIAGMFAFYRYIVKRANLTSQIEALEKDNRNKYGPEFTQDARNLTENIETFKRDFPNSTVNFGNTIPMDLAIAINKVMGRQVFKIGGTGLVK